MRKYLKMLWVPFVLAILTACGGHTYEIDQEVSVEFEGYDEYGKAQIHIDKATLSSNLTEMVELKDRNDIVEFESLITDLDVQLSPTENLKNGDDVELELLYDEENSLKIDLSLKNSKVTVENLEEIQTLTQEDIFAGIDVQFDGISPLLRGTVVQNSSSDVTSLFTYTIPEKRFKNEEEIEIVANPRSDLLERGYQADEKDFIKTIQAPVKEKYVENWDELKEEDQQYILEQIQDVVTAQIDANIKNGMNSILDKGRHVTSGRFIAEHGTSVVDEGLFLHAKPEEVESENFIFGDLPVSGLRFVYKNHITFVGDMISSREYNNKTKDYYSVVGADHLILDENGNLKRNEVNFRKFGKTDIDKETVKTETITKLVDTYTMDEISVE